MLRTAWLAVAVASVAVVAVLTPVGGSAQTSEAFPDLIQLPTGFRPEGIEIGKGTTFYVGSVASGAVYRGDLRTGEGSVLVPGGVGRSATGIELDQRNRLFVAGAGTGDAYVFDARTGDLLRTYDFASPPTFINDVVVTHDAAYFTDSSNPVVYKVPIAADGTLGDTETLELGGEYEHVPAAFNLNGIDATADGKQLVAVQSVNARLYRIDPQTGDATILELANGESVPNGDGLLLAGKTLFVVQNRSNVVAVIDVSPDLGTGTVRDRLGDPDFDVPTTIDDHGDGLYAVNARFGIADPDTVPYQVVRVG